MYRLEIFGPVGRRILEWDPDKLRQRDPNTVKTVAEAEKLFKEAIKRGSAEESSEKTTGPKMAVVGRWLA